MCKSYMSEMFVMLLVAGVLEAAPNYNYWIGGLPGQNLPTCTVLTKPCDMSVKIYASMSEQSSVIYETDKPICLCPNGQTCPSGWNAGPKTLLRDISSKGQKIGIGLHYCNEVDDERVCDAGDTAAVIEGAFYPTKVRQINCKCEHNEPLKIKKSYYEGWKLVQELVCDMPTCTENTSDNGMCKVMLNRNYETVNHCDCPAGQSCVLQRLSPDRSVGHCQ